jgi:PPOX class probable F420-dependent enzyme
MKQRDQVAMTSQEAAAFLAESRKMQLATINLDGSVHLVTMFYAMLGGQIAFWTYRSSQKARNLERDARVTCLVESGEAYFELRGVQVAGTVRCVREPDGVLDIGRLIAGQMKGDGEAGGMPADALEDYVRHAARKRLGYLVQPSRVISWDHRKLATSSPR